MDGTLSNPSGDADIGSSVLKDSTAKGYCKAIGVQWGMAFKIPDGTIVAVMYNSGSAKSTFTVAMGGKKLQFSMPASGWATVKNA
jgi:O-glycosyl hydrolase